MRSSAFDHLHFMSDSPDTIRLNQDLASQLDEAWGDPSSWVAHGLQWMHLDAVRHRMNAQVTGDPAITPLKWFFSTVSNHQGLPLQRVLVLGCGPGDVEREVARHGWAKDIVAVDLSAKVLEVARSRATAEGLSITYVQADMNQMPVGQPGFAAGSFDAVLGISSVHHCADLEHLYTSISVLLKPAGWVFLDEYVGADRFQFATHHVRFMNQLLDLLPERLRTTYDGRVKGNLWRPSVEEVVAVDPSEAVRSSEVLPLLGKYFNIVEHRPYGGAVLRVLLSDIAQNFAGSDQEHYLHSLLEAEEDLFRAGRLQRDLACVIARAQPAASQPSTVGH